MAQLKDIKRAQKESVLLKELSQLLLQITLDDSRLQNLFINRIKLSAAKSVCILFFYTPLGEKDFKEKLPILILYKPSLRKAIAQKIPARYTPELVFKYDKQFEKQRKMDELLEQLKKEGQL